MSSGKQLRYLWKRSVEKLLGTEDYYVSKRYDKYLNNGAVIADKAGIDPAEYVDLMVRYGIRKNTVGKLSPCLLSGENALARYREQLKFEKQVLETYIMSFESQCEAIKNLLEDMKFQDVMQMKSLDFDPLVKLYFYYILGLTAPSWLISLGVQELDHKRGFKRELDQGFVRSVLGV